jgi:ribulose-phosphate 3-epimerase
MITEPDRYLELFVGAGSSTLIVHQEASVHLNRSIHHIKSLGIKAGVAINPATPAGILEEIIGDVDLVLVMTVNPGFGGQAFLESTLPKIRKVREMIDSVRPGIDLLVDGGIEPDTAPKAASAGARVLVAGTAIFHHPQGIAAGMAALRAGLG